MAKLNQVLAIEKGIKTRVYAEITVLHSATKKPGLFSGHRKAYEPKEEGGETHPAEEQRVQFNATFTPGSDVLLRVTNSMTQLFDVVGTKDWTNCTARADVIVGGKTLVTGAPATYLLFLVKQIADLTTFMQSVPELDPGVTWSAVPDQATGLYTTAPTQTQRTTKVQRPVTLYEATKEHPAQTQLVTQDVIVGVWDTTKFSGCIAPVRKRQILARLEELDHAVKFALQQANAIDAEDKKLGKILLDFLFAV